MEVYVPDMYQKSIYAIDYQKLYNRGIKCLLFDLDNTLVPVKMKTPSKKIKNLFNDLKDKGFKVIIFSNSSKNRLKPFKDELEVDCAASAKKPFKKKFLQILNEFGYQINEVAIIGDQMLTDVVGGNKIGITTILVNPISKKDLFFTKFNRLIEKRIMKKLRNKDLFVKGRYYE
ncbi:MAG: YqeG family HAD IIIA-type phosphatase [Firmicutes bacterium]|nr:YqeG family HAD IIIA-type phosphatase [Bacillota bacterium]